MLKFLKKELYNLTRSFIVLGWAIMMLRFLPDFKVPVDEINWDYMNLVICLACTWGLLNTQVMLKEIFEIK